MEKCVSKVANINNYSKASNKTLAFQNLYPFSENVVNSFLGKFIIKTMFRQCSRHLIKNEVFHYGFLQ